MVSLGGRLHPESTKLDTRKLWAVAVVTPNHVGCEIPVTDSIPSLTGQTFTEGVCTITMLGAGERL